MSRGLGDVYKRQIQHGAHILEILRQVERQDEARDDPDAGETEE